MVALMSYPDKVKPDAQANIDISDLKISDATPVIPGYKVEKLINGGAMGQVYLATQEALERPVAIKVITPALSIDATFRLRFLKEGKIVAQLRHPHIVTIHDIGECLNQYYMIMEYIEGGTLKDRIKKGLSPEQAVNIMRQLASALGYAHRQGFIHRDVKPANILFRDDHNAVLSDFGIAKSCEDSVQLTATGLAIGTVLYMSPEQAQGRTLDGRSDLYSLGLLFYEMLVGFRPDRTLEGFIERLPAGFGRYQGILDRLLARNPNERFNTAEQLINALDKISDKEDDKTIVLPSTVDSSQQAKRLRLFNPYSIGIALLLVTAFLVGSGYFFWDRPLNSALSVQVSYSYRPTDQLNFRSLTNDGVLHSGDRYQIRFIPEQDGYAYIFQIDSSGKIYRLFPVEGSDTSQTANVNPVRAGMTYFVPAEDEAFQLDDQVGQEQIHFLAFRNRNVALEGQYTALVEARRVQNHSRIADLQGQLTHSLQKVQLGAMPVINFKHNERGSHDL
ncbi:serine/threonine-protein kinase [Candidatus Contendibacter odensensis]|nr:serine/threonine-protein kinase [Candidatus Contendobacter odensis]